MASYTGSRCRLCRREGVKLYLKGDRCYSIKCAMERKGYPPGQHGQSQRRKKTSEYGLQLREKQKARRVYRTFEKQFRNYFDRAERQPGITGENLLRLLERRLDSVVYRLGLASSRAEARQLLGHRHFMVNSRVVDIPSYLLKVGDEVTLRDKSKGLLRIKELIERSADRTPPAWLEYDSEQARGKVIALPARDQIDTSVQEHLIIELYSR